MIVITRRIRRFMLRINKTKYMTFMLVKTNETYPTKADLLFPELLFYLKYLLTG